jgi:hypothetical protein
MNPSANPPEPRGQRSDDTGQKTRPGGPRLFTGGLLVVLLAAAALLAAGCGKSGDPKKSEERSADKKIDPWEALGKRLRKETDLATCKSALGQLASELPNRTDVPGPTVLSPEAERAITDVVVLVPDDLQEVRQSAFTSLDAVYLAESFYLADAARSLDAAGVPDARRAELAFAWVCRQVYLWPWPVPAPRGGLMGSALPPGYVLRRGYGSGLERAYVFLALLQQLGIDGCLVGPPDAADKFSSSIPTGADGQPLTGSPKGPFWAVGARVGADILLFEPWRGEPFPGTLSALKANPDPLKPWFDDKSWGVSADDVKKGAVFLAAPLSAMAPRVELLEEKLRDATGVRLAIAPGKLRDRFTAAPPAGPGLSSSDVRFWNPPEIDRFAYVRALPRFLPLAEGGTDRADPTVSLYQQYGASQVPNTVFALPRELTEDEPSRRLKAAAYTVYRVAFLDPPSPQERIQRGQFQEAIRTLAEKEDAFKRGLERLRTDRDAVTVREWCKVVDELFRNLDTARRFDPAAEPEARAAVDRFLREQGATAQLIVDRASSEVGLAQASYLYALCRHEMAERKQVRADRSRSSAQTQNDAALAWQEARNAWRTYLERSAAHASFPGRVEHARTLAARVEKLTPSEK